MTGEPTCWLIRAGENSRHADRFATGGVVALGWPNVAGLRDLRGVDEEYVVACLRAHGIKRVSADARELLSFRDEIAVGDIVVTPDAQTREVLVGEITGPYEFRYWSPVGDYCHVRTVTWFTRMLKDALDDELAEDANYRRTLRRLEQHEKRWRDVARRARESEGRPPTAPGRRSHLRIDRARHGPDGPPSRRCGNCGLTKSLSQFEGDGDLCVDCR